VRSRDEGLLASGGRVEADRADVAREVDLHPGAHRAVHHVLERRHLVDRLRRLDDDRLRGNPHPRQRGPHPAQRVQVRDADPDAIAGLVVVDEDRTVEGEGLAGRLLLPGFELPMGIVRPPDLELVFPQSAGPEVPGQRPLCRTPIRSREQVDGRGAVPVDVVAAESRHGEVELVG
jgi:hypothetical protein